MEMEVGGAAAIELDGGDGKGRLFERQKAFEDDMAYWGKQWLMLPNPTYGSFDTATYGHDFKKPQAEQRKAKWDVIQSWTGPKQ